MKASKILSCFVAILAGLGNLQTSNAQDAPAVPEKTVRVLTIGNSFSQSLYHYFPQVVQSVPGCKLVLEDLNIGGCSLERHWNTIAAEQSDPNFKHFKKYSYQEKLQSQPWDIVSIQQASPLSWRWETYEPFAGKLIDFIQKNAPSAEIVIQQTWSYRPDQPLLAEWKIDQIEMGERLMDAYHKLGEKYQLREIPVGLAIFLARQNQPGGYQAFNPADYTYPDLPDLSRFFIGANITWNEDHTQLEGDTIHLNQRGEYLQACVWFAVLFDRDARDVTFVPEELSADDAAFLRETAQKAVDEFVQPVQSGKAETTTDPK